MFCWVQVQASQAVWFPAEPREISMGSDVLQHLHICEAQNALSGKPTTVGDPSRWTWAPFQDWDWFIAVSKVHKKLSGFPWLWCSSRLNSRELALALDAALVQIWATCGSPQRPERYQRGDLAVQEQHRNPKTGSVHAPPNKPIQCLTQPREFFPKLTQPPN